MLYSLGLSCFCSYFRILILALLVMAGTDLSLMGSSQAAPNAYLWLETVDQNQTLLHRIKPPAGYVRESVQAGSFAQWLRGLPLKPGNPPVLLYNGKPKANQQAHYAVIDIDTGSKDLQQCADAIIRLRAEYLYSQKAGNEIAFTFTSGDVFKFSSWLEGYRPTIKGSTVAWSRQSAPDHGYQRFRQYLDCIFTYAGSASLSRELIPLHPDELIIPGDVFIQGGFPGHAVLVVDTCRHEFTGERLMLLLQSYMPAQQLHILVNPLDPSTPWYPIPCSKSLFTPEWTFDQGAAKRFPPSPESR